MGTDIAHSVRHVTTIGGTRRRIGSDSFEIPTLGGRGDTNLEVKVNVDRMITVESEASHVSKP
jgi:hypothetical protein